MESSASKEHLAEKRDWLPKISTRVQAKVQISVDLPFGGVAVVKRASGGRYGGGVLRYCGWGPVARYDSPKSVRRMSA